MINIYRYHLPTLEEGGYDRLDPLAYPHVDMSWLDSCVQQHIDEQTIASMSIGEYINTLGVCQEQLKSNVPVPLQSKQLSYTEDYKPSTLVVPKSLV